jgi:hypothetical protein
MGVGTMWSGGVPTEPDVKRLLEAFPDIKPGDTVRYTDVAAIIQVDPKSSRFRSVTFTWRKRLYRDKNLLFTCDRGLGFRAYTPMERSSAGTKEVDHKLRGVVRASTDVVDRVDTTKMSEAELATHTHRVRVLRPVIVSATEGRKQIHAPVPAIAEQNPKVKMLNGNKNE